MLADRGCSRAIQQPDVIELSNDEDSLDHFAAATAASAAVASSAPCCEGEAALRPDDELVLLNYSMVRHRVGDIFVHTKSQQLVASRAEELRPMASFLCDIGMAMVLHHYPASEAAADKVKADLPAVSHLVTPFRFRCAACPFRSDTELAVVLHYQQGHVSLEGQCDHCVRNCATPDAFYRHACPGLGPRLLAPAAALEELPAACCLQLDSLHMFGVTELHGRLERGTFYGKRIVMSPTAFRGSQSDAATSQLTASAAAGLRWQAPIRSFTSEPVRLRSYAELHRPPFILCELCHGACRSFRSLARHLRSAHGLREPPDRLEAALRSLAGRRCPGCRRRFLTRRGLALHLAWGGDGAGRCPSVARPACQHCGCSAADVATLFAHLRARHPSQLIACLAQLRCPVCPPAGLGGFCSLGGFPTPGDLLQHLDVRHGLRSISLRDGQLRLDRRSRLQFECHACPARFATPQALTRHSTASGHRLACHRCVRLQRRRVEFASCEVWLAHMRVAHRSDLERCPICSKCFEVGQQFVSHVMRQHLRPCSVRLNRLPE